MKVIEEYPHILDATDSLGYTQVFNNFFDFVFSPRSADWSRQAQSMLRTRYDCVILNNTFYFKTAAARTMFLLRFS